jgi:hypothetical protein
MKQIKIGDYWLSVSDITFRLCNYPKRIINIQIVESKSE